MSGELARGEAMLREAAEMLPVAPDTLLWLADAAERLGHYPLIRSALERWAADELRNVNAQIEYLLSDAVRKAGREPREGPEGESGRSDR